MGKRKFFDILLKENLNKYSNLNLAIMYSSIYMKRINDFNICFISYVVSEKLQVPNKHKTRKSTNKW